jgi:hypothetical protein
MHVPMQPFEVLCTSTHVCKSAMFAACTQFVKCHEQSHTCCQQHSPVYTAKRFAKPLTQGGAGDAQAVLNKLDMFYTNTSL